MICSERTGTPFLSWRSSLEDLRRHYKYLPRLAVTSTQQERYNHVPDIHFGQIGLISSDQEIGSATSSRIRSSSQMASPSGCGD